MAHATSGLRVPLPDHPELTVTAWRQDGGWRVLFKSDRFRDPDAYDRVALYVPMGSFHPNVRASWRQTMAWNPYQWTPMTSRLGPYVGKQKFAAIDAIEQFLGEQPNA